MAKQIAFSRIFNNRRILNYDIYYWNRVKVKYYDGSSFTGDKEEVNPMSSAILKRNLLGFVKNLPPSCTSRLSPGL
ncbi:hypothetical protein S83_003603, partial [Arachis hypogaea]